MAVDTTQKYVSVFNRECACETYPHRYNASELFISQCTSYQPSGCKCKSILRFCALLSHVYGTQKTCNCDNKELMHNIIKANTISQQTLIIQRKLINRLLIQVCFIYLLNFEKCAGDSSIFSNGLSSFRLRRIDRFRSFQH